MIKMSLALVIDSITVGLIVNFLIVKDIDFGSAGDPPKLYELYGQDHSSLTQIERHPNPTF